MTRNQLLQVLLSMQSSPDCEVQIHLGEDIYKDAESANLGFDDEKEDFVVVIS